LEDFFSQIKHAFSNLPISANCSLLAEPGRALVAESESLIVKVNGRKGHHLYINDGIFGNLFEGSQIYSRFCYPARLLREQYDSSNLEPFSLYGPTCDSADFLPGPFMLPEDIREGDYIELGITGAYRHVLACQFNGFGAYTRIHLLDEPFPSAFPTFSKSNMTTHSN